MDWFTSLFTKGATELVGAVGSIIDEFVTSDEERLLIKARVDSAIMTHNERMGQLLAQHDREVTERHENDMNSDSWLSKNIRPMALIFVTVATIGLAYSTIFLLDPDKVKLVLPWVTLLTTLLTVMYVFYFGSRGIEKFKRLS